MEEELAVKPPIPQALLEKLHSIVRGDFPEDSFPISLYESQILLGYSTMDHARRGVERAANRIHGQWLKSNRGTPPPLYSIVSLPPDRRARTDVMLSVRLFEHVLLAANTECGYRARELYRQMKGLYLADRVRTT